MIETQIIKSSTASARQARPVRQGVLRALCLGALCIAAYLVISRGIVGTAIVQGTSMLPTLREGDRCLVNKLIYTFREPQRGDIIVFNTPLDNDASVKRIVALPSETVSIRNGRVWIDGVTLPEPYLGTAEGNTGAGRLGTGVYEVDRNAYFVVGDNRTQSADSRTFGALRREWIEGKVAWVLW